MIKLLLPLFLVISSAWSQTGRVIKVAGYGAVLIRAEKQIPISDEQELKVGDIIDSGNAIIQLIIMPATQISISKSTRLKLSEHYIESNQHSERAFSVIGFIKGLIRVNVTKDQTQEIDQKYEAEGVSFAVRGTEFELSSENDEEVSIDVVEGVVEASSPYVQSFVPEYIRASEGLNFSRKKKSFFRRNFRQKFRDHPRFIKGEELIRRWKDQKNAKRVQKKINPKRKPRKMKRDR